MFGHQDENTPVDDTKNTAIVPEPTHDGTLGNTDGPSDTASVSGAPAVTDDTASDADTTGVGDYIATNAPGQPLDLPVPASTSDSSPTNTDLLGIKQQALQQLSPLVGHLEQSPEEKFRTTMMMIQAADNQDLIKVAYEAAQQIDDEKTRAQALLDIVNEINYFTQHNS
jgi:hypothetical protein